MATAQVPYYHMAKGAVGDNKRARLVLSAPSNLSHQEQAATTNNVSKNGKNGVRNSLNSSQETPLVETQSSGKMSLIETAIGIPHGGYRYSFSHLTPYSLKQLTTKYFSRDGQTAYHWGSAKSATEMAARNKRKKYDIASLRTKQSEKRVLRWAKELNIVDQEAEEVNKKDDKSSVAFCDIVQILDRGVSNLSTEDAIKSSFCGQRKKGSKGCSRLPLLLKRSKTSGDISKKDKDIDFCQKGTALVSSREGSMRATSISGRFVPDLTLFAAPGRPPSSRLATRGSQRAMSVESTLSECQEEENNFGNQEISDEEHNLCQEEFNLLNDSDEDCHAIDDDDDILCEGNFKEISKRFRNPDRFIEVSASQCKINSICKEGSKKTEKIAGKDINDKSTYTSEQQHLQNVRQKRDTGNVSKSDSKLEISGTNCEIADRYEITEIKIEPNDVKYKLVSDAPCESVPKYSACDVKSDQSDVRKCRASDSKSEGGVPKYRASNNISGASDIKSNIKHSKLDIRKNKCNSISPQCDTYERRLEIEDTNYDAVDIQYDDSEFSTKQVDEDISLELRDHDSEPLQLGTSSFDPINVKYKTLPDVCCLKRQNTMFDQGAYVDFQHSKFKKELSDISVSSRTVRATDLNEFIKVGVGGRVKKIAKRLS